MSQLYLCPSTVQLSREAAERYAQLSAVRAQARVRPRRRRLRRLLESATKLA